MFGRTVTLNTPKSGPGKRGYATAFCYIRLSVTLVSLIKMALKICAHYCGTLIESHMVY